MPDWIVQLMGMAGAGVAVYAGIRADLAYLRAKIEGAHESASLAHQRLDELFMKGKL